VISDKRRQKLFLVTYHSSLITVFMSRENILFTVVGLLLGYLVAFHLVVYINQNQPSLRSAGAGEAADQMPPDHPAVPTDDASDRQRLLPAAEAAGKTAKEDPKNFDAQLKAADAYFQAGSFEDSIDFLTRANHLRPEDYDTVVKLGNVYSSAGRFEDAEQWYRAALAKKSDDCDARSELALTYYMRKPSQPEKAIAELRRSLEIDPSHVPSLHNLSLMLMETKQFAESESILARLEKADPSYEQLPRLRSELEKARGGSNNTPAVGAGKTQKKLPTD
jgi:tetratricopeptide (TPR) repeat protein